MHAWLYSMIVGIMVGLILTGTPLPDWLASLTGGIVAAALYGIESRR